MAPEPSLLFLNQHYWPDVASTGQHLTDLAEYLAGDGFDVSVLSATAGYTGGEVDALLRQRRNGVDIRRLRTPGLGRDSHVGRALDYAAFHLQAAVHTVRARDVDLLVSLTTPSLLPATVATASQLTGVPFAVWAMDLHPEVEARLDVLPSPALDSLHRASRWAYRRADVVVALGPVMAARIEAKGVPDERIHQIPVWNREDEVCPVARAENSLRRELGLEDAFVVMYSGNAGLAHRFDEVVEAMSMLRDEEDVAFVFVGDGPRRPEIEEAVRERGVEHFRYLDYFPREELDRSLSLADVHLLTLREDMAGLAAPGKLYGILAAGRPVLMVGPERSEPGLVVATESVGEVIEPADDPTRGGERLAEAILRLKRDEAKRIAWGERARELFEERFTRRTACGQWAELLRRRLA